MTHITAGTHPVAGWRQLFELTRAAWWDARQADDYRERDLEPEAAYNLFQEAYEAEHGPMPKRIWLALDALCCAHTATSNSWAEHSYKVGLEVGARVQKALEAGDEPIDESAIVEIAAAVSLATATPEVERYRSEVLA